MAEKIVVNIEKYADKTADEFSTALADPHGKLETGSAAAETAALSAALLLRAAAISAEKQPGEQRLEYVLRNAEILRKYMVHLIDEDVKSRGPLRKAILGGNAQEIDAARQPAVAIPGEIVNMMGRCMELIEEISAYCPKEAAHYLASGAELAMAAMRSARHYIVHVSDESSDETYRFVTRRENEITLEEYENKYSCLMQKLEKLS